MTTQKTAQNRREFLHKTLWIFASLPVMGVALSACTKSPDPANSGGVTEAQNKLPAGALPAKEEDPVAASLGYKMSAQNVDTEKFPKRKGPGGDKQLCKNCQFYSAANDNWGSCQIIRSGVVTANGWCNTWALKPGASL